MNDPRIIKFTVPGEPVPWARAGTNRGRRYTPRRQAAHIETIRQAWMIAGRPSFGESPVSLSIQFYCSRGHEADIAKLILDAVSGYLYVDDSQVVCLSGIHRFEVDADPRTKITAWVAQGRAA